MFLTQYISRNFGGKKVLNSFAYFINIENKTRVQLICMSKNKMLKFQPLIETCFCFLFILIFNKQLYYFLFFF